MEENNKIIRVAQVIGMAINGGTEVFAMNYYEHIDRSKVQFDFFVESESKIINRKKIEDMGGKVVIIPSYKNVFKYQKVLVKLFKEGNYDIVHSNMNALSVFTLRAAKKAGVKIRIAHSHSTANKKSEWKKNILKALLKPLSKKYATHYFACSEFAGRWLFGNKAFDNGRVTIINNAIDIERFRFKQDIRDSLRKNMKIEDKFVIGNVGRFVPQKNHIFLLEVFYEYQKNNSNSVLLLVGDGPLKKQIIKKANEYGILEKIIFAGVHEDVSPYYNAMDCFVFPSLYEGLGIAAIEAQINGLFTILSDNITSEVKINNNVFFESLKKNGDYWNNVIMRNYCNNNRENAYKMNLSSKYNIDEASESLVKIYKYILNQEVL